MSITNILFQDDLLAFQASHFTAKDTNSHPGRLPTDEDPDEAPVVVVNDHESGLGFYADGAERTLTDEQIAMFRHSEIQALLREKRQRQEEGIEEEEGQRDTFPTTSTSVQDHHPQNHASTGVLANAAQSLDQRFASTKKRKLKQDQINASDARRVHDNWNPSNLLDDSLDYGEVSPRQTDHGTRDLAGHHSVRRLVSYEDVSDGMEDIPITDKAQSVKFKWPRLGS